jgi:hypothetical protein
LGRWSLRHEEEEVKYVLLLCSDVSSEDYEARAAAMTGCDGWGERMRRRGVLVGGAGLRPADEATTLRVRDDEVLLSDGPFAETKDQIGGFNVVECADLDEALAVAAAHPWARVGQIEVRPVWEP